LSSTPMLAMPTVGFISSAPIRTRTLAGSGPPSLCAAAVAG